MNYLEKLQDSRRLVGFAISFDPEEIIPEITPGNPLGEGAAKFVQKKVRQTKTFQENPIQAGGAYVVLANGVTDVDTIVQHTAKHYGRQVTPGELLDVFSQAETIQTIAKHARFSEKVLRHALYVGLSSSTDTQTLALDTDSHTLQTTEYFQELNDYYQPESGRGCPLALPVAGEKLDPLFVNFTKWASELSIRSLYNSR